MSRTGIIDSRWVCQDCVLVVAGYEKDQVALAEEDFDYISGCVNLLMKQTGARHISIEDDQKFSWRPCGCCSGLAGNRTLIHLVGEVEEVSDEQ